MQQGVEMKAIFLTGVFFPLFQENAKQMVDEMYRVLKPGGQLNGFEIPYERDPVQRAFYSLFTDWGTDWHKGSADANQGPEPYMGEYEECNLPSYLQQVGFKNVKETKYSYFESIFTATKWKKSTKSKNHKLFVNSWAWILKVWAQLVCDIARFDI